MTTSLEHFQPHPREKLVQHKPGSFSLNPDELQRDHLLTRRSREGDKEAFRMVYELYRLPVFKLSLWRTRRWQDAEDITQESFTRAWDKLTIGPFKETDAPLLNWIFTVAENQAKDMIRRKRPTQDVDEIQVEDEGEYSNPFEFVKKLEEHELLWRLIAELSPSRRDVIGLRFGVGLTVKVTAEVSGKNESNVKVLTHLGVADLRSKFKQEGYI